MRDLGSRPAVHGSPRVGAVGRHAEDLHHDGGAGGAVHAGKLLLDQKVTIDAKYQGNDFGTFQQLTLGSWIAFRDALVTMIIVSDNTCTGSRGFAAAHQIMGRMARLCYDGIGG
ncbi:MAG TPA: serine hydrolase [Methylomirabilota bacterium]|nr:serine hydrolase [Methylomirabilota bacterium]